MVKTGHTLSEMVEKFRLKQSHQWLVNQCKSEYEVARACGYVSIDEWYHVLAKFWPNQTQPVNAYSQPLSIAESQTKKWVKDESVSLVFQPAKAFVGRSVCEEYSQMRNIFDQLFAKIQDRSILGAMTLYKHDPWLYYADKPAYTSGFIVDHCVYNSGEVEKICPGGWFLTTVHKGSYANLESSYRKLYTEVYHRGDCWVSTDDTRDEYLNQIGPGIEEKDLLTQVSLPVIKR
jgi:effector-binding domain-containing protein